MNYKEFLNTFFKRNSFDLPLLEDLLKQAKGPILEVGCGPGRLVPLFAKTGLRVHLLDIDPAMVAEAKQEVLRHKAGNLEVHQGSGTALPFADEEFDLVVFPMLAIEEMGPLFGAVAEAKRVLKPGGKLYFSCQNPARLRSEALGLFRQWEPAREDSISMEALRHPQRGPHLHQLFVESRGPNGRIEKFHVEQGMLLAEGWNQLLTNAGFCDIRETCVGTSENFDVQSMNYKSVTAIKKPQVERDSSNSETASRFFDRLGTQYDEATKEENYPTKTWLRNKLSEYRNLHPLVLDLGVGRGMSAQLLKEVGCVPCSLYGIEISENMRKLTARDGGYDAIWNYDLNQPIPLERHQIFDLILAIGVFEFIDSPAELMTWMHDLLRFGGRVIATFPLKDMAVDHPEGRFEIRGHDQKSIQALADQAGLKILRYEEAPAYRLIREPRPLVNNAFVEFKREDKFL